MNYAVSDISFSDHNLVSFGVGFQLYKGNLTCFLNFRNITGIDLSVLSPCIDNLMAIDASASTNDLVSHYNNGFVKLLDTLAPQKTQTFPSPILSLDIHLNFASLKLLAIAWNVSSEKLDLLFIRTCISVINNTIGKKLFLMLNVLATLLLFCELKETLVLDIVTIYVHSLLQSVMNLWGFLNTKIANLHQ